MHTTLKLAEVAGSTATIYLFLLVGLRTVGRRQLEQLTVIDLVVVLILGSAVETAMIHGDISLPAALVSVTTLLMTNRLITWIFSKSKRLRHLFGGGPVLVVHNGRPVEEHLRRIGMTDADLDEALRGRGYESPDGIRFAVLETDGTVSVVPAEDKKAPD
jgi:uncharacterized membrane protein YcaP (DUF421 family)